jgi:uncharacterized protein
MPNTSVSPIDSVLARCDVEQENDYDIALAEMRNEHPNIELVLALLQKSADNGDNRSQYALATWYLFGTNVEKNFYKAVYYLKKSAARGNSDAMFDLAVCFDKGAGIATNRKKAYCLFLKSALRGDVTATHEVGRRLFYGIGVEKDKTSARVWLDRAHELGYREEDS